jgi:FkbM family methyltransferase
MRIDLYRLFRFLYRGLEAKELNLYYSFLIPKQDRSFLLKWAEFKSWSNSTSQLGQEFLPIFYGHELGFFCEVGANDGLRFSNTFFLESMGWNGVLIEPDPRNLKPLTESRSVSILPFCATNDDDIEINLNLAKDTLYSGISPHELKKKARAEDVAHVLGFKLVTMLEKVSAPKFIDFMSIDTEGNEFEVLLGMDFHQYQVAILCVEHNYDYKKLKKIRLLLHSYGYRQVLKAASQFDAWFIKC